MGTERSQSSRPFLRRPPVEIVHKRLAELSALRSQIAPLRSIREIAGTGARLALKHLHGQSAAVFLFGRTGLLQRIVTVGRRIDGTPIPPEWFPDESHAPGASFTGRCVTPTATSSFGSPQLSNDLAEDSALEASAADLYAALLGTLRCALGVPLNGRYRSFGVLEVINKLAGGRSPHFSVEDVHWLVGIGTEIAYAISALRRESRIALLDLLGKAAARPAMDSASERALYSGVARQVTSDPFAFRVCIIRQVVGGNLVLAAQAADDGIDLEGRTVLESWGDRTLPAEALRTGHLQYLPDIASLNEKDWDLPNAGWAKDHGLVSYLCIPAKFDDNIYGTISLYTGYSYKLSPDEEQFLQTVGALTGGVMAACRNLQQSTELVNEDLRDALLATDYRRNSPSLHVVTEVLRKIAKRLRDLDSLTLPQSVESRIREISDLVSSEEERLKNELQNTFSEPVDVNELIQSVVRQRKEQRFASPVVFRLRLDRRIPSLIVHRTGMKWVLRDIVVNATKAIERSGRQYGEIDLSTKCVVAGGVEYVEILCSDTGCGIPAEEREHIFDWGVSLDSKGSGLGLALAREALGMYQGEIAVVESTVGEGTTIRVRIPTRHSA